MTALNSTPSCGIGQSPNRPSQPESEPQRVSYRGYVLFTIASGIVAGFILHALVAHPSLLQWRF